MIYNDYSPDVAIKYFAIHIANYVLKINIYIITSKNLITLSKHHFIIFLINLWCHSSRLKINYLIKLF